MPPVLYIHVLIKLYRNPMKWASFSTCYRGSAVKNPPVNAEDLQEMRVQSLGWKDPLEQEMATHSNILAWEIPWTEELVGYSPWGRKRVNMTASEHNTQST